MDFVRYIKLSLFFCHLDLYFWLNLQIFLPKISSITFNEFTVKDYFAFAKEIVHQNGKLFMGSPDADSLFTNTPLKETINICTNLLNNVDVIESINKSEFRKLLSLATQESYFMFNNILYKQKDSVAMELTL